MPPWQNPATKHHNFGLFHTKKTKKVKDSIIAEAVAHHSFHYLMRILMNANDPGTKSTYKPMYNLILKVKTLLMTMAELDPRLMVTSLDGNSTLITGNDKFPTTKKQFKKYFNCNWEVKNRSHQQNQIRLRCQINGNHTLNNIKHSVKPNKLLTWLAKEKVYLEADAFGIGKTKTIQYLTQIHPRLVNHTHLKMHHYDILKMTHISTKEVTKLDDSLTKHTNTMTEINKDTTIHCPTFEVFQTTIGTGLANARMETDIMGIKCQAGKAALLREFFLHTTATLEQKLDLPMSSEKTRCRLSSDKTTSI